MRQADLIQQAADRAASGAAALVVKQLDEQRSQQVENGWLKQAFTETIGRLRTKQLPRVGFGKAWLEIAAWQKGREAKASMVLGTLPYRIHLWDFGDETMVIFESRATDPVVYKDGMFVSGKPGITTWKVIEQPYQVVATTYAKMLASRSAAAIH